MNIYESILLFTSSAITIVFILMIGSFISKSENLNRSRILYYTMSILYLVCSFCNMQLSKSYGLDILFSLLFFLNFHLVTKRMERIYKEQNPEKK